MNYYEHWLGDYRKKTARLRPLEHGVYRLLLDEYYANESPLPAEFDDLYRLCGAVAKDEQTAVRKVAEQFFPVADDGLRHNERADEEIEKAQRRINRSRQNGRGHTSGNPPGDPTGTSRDTSQDTHEEPRGIPASIPTGNPPATSLGVPHTPHAMHQPQKAKTEERNTEVFVSPDRVTPWPGNLTRETWATWKAHLASKGKGMTPQTERLQLVRLGEHPDPEATVRDTIERGRMSLPPVGGYPSDRRADPRLEKLTPSGQRTAANLAGLLQSNDEGGRNGTQG